MNAGAPSLILSALLLLQVFTDALAASDVRVVVYSFHTPCPECPREQEPVLQYIDELMTALRPMGVRNVWVRYASTDAQAERDLDGLFQTLGVPESMKGSIVVSLDKKFLFINFVPAMIISDFLANHTEEYGKIVVLRDQLRDTYRIMREDGQIVEGIIENSVMGYLEPTSSWSRSTWSTLAVIIGSGVLDGINPCAFAVLLFFVTVLFTVDSSRSIDRLPRNTRRRVLLLGSIYIVALYLTYLAIGLTLRELITKIPFRHLISRVGAVVLIGAGVVNIKDRLWPDRGIALKLSPSQWRKTRKWMNRTSLFATFVLGVLVALFEFPCTGSIYLAIISVLAVQTTLAQGLAYLLVYNLAFVLPMTVILIFACNKKVVEFSLRRWRQREEKRLRLVQGLTYIGLGVFLFLAGFV